jgi:hypothetical protein
MSRSSSYENIEDLEKNGLKKGLGKGFRGCRRSKDQGCKSAFLMRASGL